MKILLLFLLAITGALTIYTDCLQKKIKNMHLALISISGILIYILLIYRGEIALTPEILINPVAGLLIGIALYAAKLWKAGDAKLFATYSLIILPGNYSSLLPLPCLMLFVNTFLAGLLFMLPFLFRDIIMKRNMIFAQLISKNTLLLLLNSFLITFAISWIILPLIGLAGLNRYSFLSFILLYLGYIYIFKLFNLINKSKLLSAVILALGFLLRYILVPSSFSFANISMYIKYLLALSLLFLILRIAMRESKAKMQRIPFAPFMLAGALLSYTDFLKLVINLIIK